MFNHAITATVSSMLTSTASACMLYRDWLHWCLKIGMGRGLNSSQKLC